MAPRTTTVSWILAKKLDEDLFPARTPAQRSCGSDVTQRKCPAYEYPEAFVRV